MIHYLFSLILISLTFYFSKQIEPNSEISLNSTQLKAEENPNYSKLREWLGKLVIDLPNELIEEETKGALKDLTLYGITLEKIITEPPKKVDNKVGVTISVENAGLNVKGVYSLPLIADKKFVAIVSKLNVKLPFFLVRNEENGLVSEVDTSGFNIDLDNVEIKLDSDLLNALVPLLKEVLKLIKTNVIEKNLIETMNTKIGEMFQKVNNIILNGVEPKPLNIAMKEQERIDLKKSSIISAVGFLLNNLTGADGPLSLNNLANIFTFDTGIISLHEFYNKSIHFEFNLTDKDNSSLGNFEVGLEDLNVSGLNTWKNFTALEPYNKILLHSYTDLQDLTINISFSLKIKLDNTSNLVTEETILYEKAYLRTNLVNNTLKAFIQLPINEKKAKDYTNKECLNLDCITDLADSNGTGVTALSLNETFTYIVLEVDEEGGLEEDVDDTIDKLVQLFISSFDDKISLLINALLNTTVIDFVNEKINNYLYTTSCPGISDPDDNEINKSMTSFAFIIAFVLFTSLIFCPYILGKACGKGNDTIKVNLFDKEEINERITNASEIKNVKGYDMESRYCFQGLSIQWIKEFGRMDPAGASLFLHPQISIFWRIFIPLAIIGTIALFISSNSSTGASVFIVFQIGRRIQIPSLFDFGLINSVRDMWKAGVYPLSVIVALFSGIWPYLKLVLMLISFVLPASLFNKKKRGKILRFLDATGKWSILDSYVMILMLVAFHFHIAFPVIPPSEAEQSSIIDVFVYAAYGFFTLILGTVISLFLSHIITHLHRSLDEHPDQNKGEKAESYTALISFAENSYLPDKFFRILITILLFSTLGLVIIGSNITSFSFYFHGLAGYALDLFKISPHRDYSIIELGFNVPESYEDPNDGVIRFTQVIYFLTVFIMPVAMLLTVIFLWLVPLPRKAQKFLYTITEILNAWSCLDVFVVAIIAAIAEIGQFTQFIVGDKCDAIDPIIDKYFYKTLDGHNTCFEVKAYLKSGCWILFIAAIIFFICSYIVMKVCRNALNERLPDNVKEYLKSREYGERISSLPNLNESNNISEYDNKKISLIQVNNNKRVSNINDSKISSNNNDLLEEENN